MRVVPCPPPATELGRTKHAEQWRSHLSAREASGLLVKLNRVTEAVHWYRKAADRGDDGALSLAVRALNEAGRTAEGARLRTYGWEPDGCVAQPWAAD